MAMADEFAPEIEARNQEDIRRKIAELMGHEAVAAPVRAAPRVSPQTVSREPVHGPDAAAQPAVQVRSRRKPSAGLIAFAAFLLLCVFRPWLVVGLTLLAVWIVLGVYVAFGPERVHRFAMRRFGRFRARHPERAETLRLRAQSIVRRVEKLVERLPESWRDGLYLPQFDDPAAEPAHEKMRHDPFDRLHRD
jgi:hypothetical protein